MSNPPLIAERDDPAWSALPPRERPQAFDLLTGVIRWRGTLDAVLKTRVKQPYAQLEPTVRALLWIGAYQLLQQSGTQAYAAVDSTVELAKQVGLGRAAGLVNAVLRGITRLRPTSEPRGELSARAFPRDFTTQVQLSEPVFVDPARDVVAHLAAATSHPQELVRMLLRAHGPAAALGVLIRNNQRPVVNLRCDAADFTPPPESGLQPHQTPGFFVATDGWNPLIAEAVASGTLSPQDPTAAKAVRQLVKHLPPAPEGAPLKVLDLCAGLGTKSIQLARASQTPLAITASDVDSVKLQRLLLRAKALKLSSIETQSAESLQPPASTEASAAAPVFDAALVDVPCSNSGVMSRRVQSRWRWPKLDREQLALLQGKLLTQAAALVRPGGMLVYSTCSIDPMENGKVIDTFLQQQGQTLGRVWRVAEQETTLPSTGEALLTQHDGGYWAVLRQG